MELLKGFSHALADVNTALLGLITSYVIVAELLAKLLLLLWRYVHIVLISSNQV